MSILDYFEFDKIEHISIDVDVENKENEYKNAYYTLNVPIREDNPGKNIIGLSLFAKMYTAYSSNIYISIELRIYLTVKKGIDTTLEEYQANFISSKAVEEVFDELINNYSKYDSLVLHDAYEKLLEIGYMRK